MTNQHTGRPRKCHTVPESKPRCRSVRIGSLSGRSVTWGSIENRLHRTGKPDQPIVGAVERAMRPQGGNQLVIVSPR